MLKKIIQILVIIILLTILSLIIIILFNPFNSRTKLIGGIINSYLSQTIDGYTPIDKNTISNTADKVGEVIDKNPLINAEQEKVLESLGVDVTKLPTTITPEMQTCFVEALGQARADELVKGATPSAVDLFKARDCLGE